MRVLSVSTDTHFITGLVSLDFCEGYMKEIFLFFKKFEKKLERNFKPSVKNLHGPKARFFHCEEYMDVKIMSRVLVGFGETADHRGRTPDADADGRTDMDFLNVCYTRAPKGQKLLLISPDWDNFRFFRRRVQCSK